MQFWLPGPRVAVACGRMAALLTFVSVYMIVRFPLAALILLALVLAD